MRKNTKNMAFYHLFRGFSLTPSKACTKRCLHQAMLAPSGTIPKSPIPSFSKSELAQIAYFLSWNSPELLF
jgi:hypothetical protein